MNISKANTYERPAAIPQENAGISAHASPPLFKYKEPAHGNHAGKNTGKHVVRRVQWLPLAGIIAVHAGVLALAQSNTAPPKPMPIAQTVTAAIIPAPVAEITPPKPMSVAAPKPTPEPKPKPVSKPLPKPKAPAKPKPAPLPPVAQAPSERAVTVDPERSEPVAREIPAAQASAAEAASSAPSEAPQQASAPVTPPRTDAAHLNNPAPAYPSASRKWREEGQVLIDVYILPDGSVGEIKLKRSSGFTRLDDAALTAVRRWKFVPARRGTQPIPYWYVQPVTFSLDR